MKLPMCLLLGVETPALVITDIWLQFPLALIHADFEFPLIFRI